MDLIDISERQMASNVHDELRETTPTDHYALIIIIDP